VKRLLLVVEGAAEQQFVMSVLAPHLAACGITVPKPRLPLTGKSGRGGIVNYEHAKRAITSWTRQEKGTDVAFSTMFDLYKLPSNFPGHADAKSKGLPYAVVDSLERSLKDDIGDDRFIPYIQLHEFEAILFTDPQALLGPFTDRKKEVAELSKVVDQLGNPEEIDDGESTSPSKRIIKLIPEYRGAKRAVAHSIARQIGIDRIREACKHFNDWLTKLEELE